MASVYYSVTVTATTVVIGGQSVEGIPSEPIQIYVSDPGVD